MELTTQILCSSSHTHPTPAIPWLHSGAWQHSSILENNPEYKYSLTYNWLLSRGLHITWIWSLNDWAIVCNHMIDDWTSDARQLGCINSQWVTWSHILWQFWQIPALLIFGKAMPLAANGLAVMTVAFT